MKFTAIKVPETSDLIIKQILDLLKTGRLEPGEQLPSELVLQKEFNVTKQQLKAAFKRLEIYGVVETKPQAGTYIADIHLQILVGLVTNVLNISREIDWVSLTDTRLALEPRAAELAAQHITADELAILKTLHQQFVEGAKAGNRNIEIDILLHMEIIRFSQNTTMISLYSFITKDLIAFYHQFDNLAQLATQKRLDATIVEHQNILDALEKRDSQKAGEVMRLHLNSVYQEALQKF